MGKRGKSANKYRVLKIDKKDNKKSFKSIIIVSILLLVMLLGSSYALFSTVRNANKNVEVEAGTFKINFADTNYINLTNAYPMTDQEGLNTSSYSFTITNEGNINSKYNVSLEEKDGNTLDKRYIKYSIRENNGSWSTPSLLSTGIVLADSKELNSTDSVSYELKLWLDESAPNEVQGKTYSAKIVVSSSQSNSTVPDISQPIINLNGADVINIEQNNEFIDPGVSSIKSSESLDVSLVTTRYEYYDGTILTSVNSVDTTKIGTYYIYYEISDSNNNKGLSIRTINVYKKDTAPPTITLIGD